MWEDSLEKETVKSDTERRKIKRKSLKELAVSAVAPATVTPRVPTKPDIYDNARFERSAYAGLSQRHDGSPDHLIPTLNLIHLSLCIEENIPRKRPRNDPKKYNLVE